MNLRRVLKTCLGILYPQTCYFCGKIGKERLCTDCAKKVEYIKEPRCKKCGKPIRYWEREFCHDCTGKDFTYEQGRSIWLHKGPVRWSVYQYKYHNHRIYAEFYAEELFRLYGHKLKEWNVDVIIPIPLHKKKKRKRGYNQAEVLAKRLGNLSGIRVDCKSVIRARNTKAQKELNDKERNKNLRNAFEVTKLGEADKNVLLVDDIYTTGSTIDSVSQILIEKGAKKVFFFTISIGQGF